MDAIEAIKDKIKEKGGDMDNKDFDKIMKEVGSKSGVDTAKG